MNREALLNDLINMAFSMEKEGLHQEVDRLDHFIVRVANREFIKSLLQRDDRDLIIRRAKDWIIDSFSSDDIDDGVLDDMGPFDMLRRLDYHYAGGIKQFLYDFDLDLFDRRFAAKNHPLNKPFRTPGGPKKFSVYVKNDKGNIVKVNFGDPNMEIKRDDPERRKSYRARHNCSSPGPKWKANYWSCRMWEGGESVSEVLD